ncbi:isoprenoid synthase domain-containing protein [Apodospora peruviana]|uniref:Terpene synthase n=1 Tax=Apodospora peruviana TaxID=516989 RepID=A0AAE0M3W3_9PEZI|nr:isoprenoid synthase domain-containing protein [Apodospora peruviana]
MTMGALATLSPSDGALLDPIKHLTSQTPHVPLAVLTSRSTETKDRNTVFDDSVMEPINDPNSALATKLRGKILNIPAATAAVFRGRKWPSVEVDETKWTAKQQARYQRLQRDAMAVLDRAFADYPEMLQKFKGYDFALFNFTWYPETEDYETLWTASLFIIWLFVWDDQCDVGDNPAISDDFERACIWRKETLAQIKGFLGLTGEGEDDFAETATNGPMLVFKEFGERAVPKWNLDQCRRHYDEIKRFIDATEIEHSQRLAGYLPSTMEEYLELRHDSSSIYTCFVVLELFLEYPMPNWVFELEELKAVLKAGNYVVATHNDIFSLKKEIAHDCLINIIPVLYKAGSPWENIMHILTADLRENCERLDQAAALLLEKSRTLSGGDPDLQRSLAQFVDGVRHNCTGNLNYSLVSKRYNCTAKNIQKDGSYKVVL